VTKQGPQAWDRYAYVNNAPINFTDPTGHTCEDAYDPACVSWNASAPYSPEEAWNYGRNDPFNYDGQKAAAYALENKDTDEVCIGNDCTNFASKALSEGGGLKPNKAWVDVPCDTGGAWNNTTSFYDYLTSDKNGPQYKFYKVTIGSSANGRYTLTKDPSVNNPSCYFEERVEKSIGLK
jgi:hypothetical protein